jgi:hypothetical protein
VLSQAKQVVLLAQRREVPVVHTDEKLTAFLVFEELTDQFLRRSTMRCISRRLEIVHSIVTRFRRQPRPFEKYGLDDSARHLRHSPR